MPDWDAILKQKGDLIEAQSAEIYHLRRAIGRAIAILNDAQAGYMSANGWVRQIDDGEVVPINDQ